MRLVRSRLTHDFDPQFRVLDHKSVDRPFRESTRLLHGTYEGVRFDALKDGFDLYSSMSHLHCLSRVDRLSPYPTTVFAILEHI